MSRKPDPQPNSQSTALRSFVVALADEASSSLAGGVRAAVMAKGRRDVVTSADLATEHLLRRRILARFPDDRLVGEEYGASSSPHHTRTWWIDPIDGTANFVRGDDRWCVSIAVGNAEEGLIAAAIGVPSSGECFSAARGGGATIDGRPLQVSTPTDLGECVVASGFGDRPDSASSLASWSAVLPRVRGVRCSGSAALDLCDVARGYLDAYWEQGIAEWDTAAGILIALESGAAVSTLRGEPVTTPARAVLAAAPTIHGHMVSLVQPDAEGDAE